MNIKALFVTILIIFASSTLHGASFKAVEKLTTDSTQKRLQALLKKGYQCEKSSPAPSSSWHCLKQEQEISFNELAIYANCEALDICHLGTNQALGSLFKGEPRAIQTLSIHDHNESIRWHCLEPGRGTLRLCLKSQNSPSKQDVPLFGWPDQLTAKR